MGLLVNRNNPESVDDEQLVQDAARAFKLPLLVQAAAAPDEIERAFAAFAREKVSGVSSAADPYYTGQARPDRGARGAPQTFPVIYSNREYVKAGGLIGYGNNIPDVYRRAGIYTGRVLKGDKPADLPVDRATKFELVVNMKTPRSASIFRCPFRCGSTK